MAERWGCAPGTVQQAYRELARQGLVIGRPGQNAHRRNPACRPVAAAQGLRSARTPGGGLPARSARRRLHPCRGGAALRAALGRWRALCAEAQQASSGPNHPPLRPAADPAVSLLAARFPQLCVQGCTLEVAFPGSLGGEAHHALAEEGGPGRVSPVGCGERHLQRRSSGSCCPARRRAGHAGASPARLHRAVRQPGGA